MVLVCPGYVILEYWLLSLDKCSAFYSATKAGAASCAQQHCYCGPCCAGVRRHSSGCTNAMHQPAIANCINTPLPSPPPALAPHWQPDLGGNVTGPQRGVAGQSSLELTLDQSQASPCSSVGRAGRKVWHSPTKHERFALAALAKRLSAILRRIKSWKPRTSQTLVVPKGDGIRSGSVRQVVEVGNSLLGALWCVPQLKHG